MCNYCGCRAVDAVGRLTDEHEQIGQAASLLDRAIVADDLIAAAGRLAELRTLLEPHLAVEEGGLFPIMAAHEEFADGVATLFDDHDDIDVVLAAAEPDWAQVRRAIARLHEHIDREEHGLFPAALATLTPAQWNHVDTVRARYTSPPGRGEGGLTHDHAHACHRH